MTPDVLPLTLVASELESITGYRRPAMQGAELSRRGWHFEVARDGRPIVSRAYAEAKLAGQAAAQAPAKYAVRLPGR